MKKKTQEVRVVIDPTLPPDVAELIKAAPINGLRRSDFSAPKDNGVPVDMDAVARGVKKTLTGGLVWIVAWASVGKAADASLPGHPSQDPENHKLFEYLAWMVNVVGMGGVVLCGTACALFFMTRSAERQRLRSIREAHGRYILTSQLDERALAILDRAQSAATTVLKSQVADLIDQQRNTVVLPSHLWEIASRLAKYSHLVRETPSQAQGPSVVKVLNNRATALELSLQKIERRVVALEAYAVQAQETDALYAEWLQIKALDSSSGDVLDLLAETAADDLAVAEIEGLRGEAAAVGNAFKTSLEAARAAAIEALPALPALPEAA